MGLNLDPVIEYILINYRWVFVIFFLLPLSLIYDIFYYLRAWIVFKLNSAPKQHNFKVNYVQKQVKQWIADGKKEKMCTARPGWQTVSFRQPKYKNILRQINVNLVDIVSVDVERKVVKVEPLATMGQITKILEPIGWTIPIVPELEELTIGGLVNGTGIETSSHKFGLFQHICQSFELVMANGEVVNCSKDENEDLFYSVPWSYGTLGFLVSAEIKIIPAERFVKVQYYPVHSLDLAVKTLEKFSKEKSGNEFVEGIMFNIDQGVIMVGNMSCFAEPGKVNNIGDYYKPWFFKHVESFLAKKSHNEHLVEYIPLRDYYHRHSRAIFWEIQEIIPFGNNPFFRYLLGWMTPPKVSLLKLTQPKAVKKLYEEKHVIQDILVPISKLKDSLILFDKETNIYPLWLCPFVLPKNPGMVHPKKDAEEMYVDIGAYGVPKTISYEAEKTTRKIEAFVREVNGFQMLYADTYMTKDEFRNMFDHSLYDKVRNKYKCEEAFPEIYDKVSLYAREGQK